VVPRAQGARTHRREVLQEVLDPVRLGLLGGKGGEAGLTHGGGGEGRGVWHAASGEGGDGAGGEGGWRQHCAAACAPEQARGRGGAVEIGGQHGVCAGVGTGREKRLLSLVQ
jgi:hypothetical protein